MVAIKVLSKSNKYGVICNGIEAVPFVYDSKMEAIQEWAYFEYLNFKRPECRRFLDHITQRETIDIIVNKYRNKSLK